MNITIHKLYIISIRTYEDVIYVFNCLLSNIDVRCWPNSKNSNFKMPAC